MGIAKVGIKIFNPVVEKLVQKTGVKSVLQTKAPIFHGINPTATYLPSGKSFALPRFCSQEMKQARQMNKIAIQQAKAGEVVRTYPKATPQDLKRLTSETIEDSYSRVEWTNPKDGKVYNLLKQGETEDGKVIVRILDEQGAFIKETEIIPKVHVLIDDTMPGKAFRQSDYFKFKEIQDMSHAELMIIGAKRNNPFEKVILFDIHSDKIHADAMFLERLSDITKKLEKGKKIDYISISRRLNKEQLVYAARTQTLNLTPEQIEDILKSKSLTEMINKAKEKGTRVLIASGNEGAISKNDYLMKTGAEGVGAIQNGGKIASYSSSRSSILTQHYEQSGYPIRFTEKGANVTGTTGTDLYINNHFIGKQQSEIKTIHQNIRDKMTELEHEADRLSSEGLFTPQKQKELNDRYIALKKEFNYITLNTMFLEINKDGIYVFPKEILGRFGGTSLATAVRTAKLALNDMMEGVL